LQIADETATTKEKQLISHKFYTPAC